MITRIRNKIYSVEEAIQDCRASVELSKFGLSYRAWTRSAIAPSALLTVLNDIDINNRNTIVEFGCGLSTIYIAKLLQRTGGQITSFESDSNWATVVQTWLDEEGLSDQVELVVAPLAPCSINIDGLHWYEQRTVEGVISKLSIDCLLVDGPVAYQKVNELARYPALPIIRHRLADTFVIFLDDIRRKGEQAILKKWADELGIHFTMLPSRGGIAIGTKGPAFNSNF